MKGRFLLMVGVMLGNLLGGVVRASAVSELTFLDNMEGRIEIVKIAPGEDRLAIRYLRPRQAIWLESDGEWGRAEMDYLDEERLGKLKSLVIWKWQKPENMEKYQKTMKCGKLKEMEEVALIDSCNLEDEEWYGNLMRGDEVWLNAPKDYLRSNYRARLNISTGRLRPNGELWEKPWEINYAKCVGAMEYRRGSWCVRNVRELEKKGMRAEFLLFNQTEYGKIILDMKEEENFKQWNRNGKLLDGEFSDELLISKIWLNNNSLQVQYFGNGELKDWEWSIFWTEDGREAVRKGLAERKVLMERKKLENNKIENLSELKNNYTGVLYLEGWNADRRILMRVRYVDCLAGRAFAGGYQSCVRKEYDGGFGYEVDRWMPNQDYLKAELVPVEGWELPELEEAIWEEKEKQKLEKQKERERIEKEIQEREELRKKFEELKNQEGERVEMEKSRVEAENLRMASEDKRIEKEKIRKANELRREKIATSYKKDEAARKSGETIRKNEENVRKKAEEMRKRNEIARKKAEEERAKKELERKKTEVAKNKTSEQKIKQLENSLAKLNTRLVAISGAQTAGISGKTNRAAEAEIKNKKEEQGVVIDDELEGPRGGDEKEEIPVPIAGGETKIAVEWVMVTILAISGIALISWRLWLTKKKA